MILTTKDIAEAIGSHNYGPDILNNFRLAEAAVIAKLAQGVSVEPSKEITDFLRQLIHGDFMADNPKDLDAALRLKSNIELHTATAIAAARLQAMKEAKMTGYCWKHSSK